MSIISKFTEQRSTGTFIGGLKDVLAHTLFWVSLINFVLVAATAYNTTLWPYIATYARWANFFVFMGFLAILVGVAMLVEYRVIIPSVMAFRNKQEYEHKNLLRGDLEKIYKKLEELEKKIK